MAFSSWLSTIFPDTRLNQTLARARLMFEEIQRKPIIDGILLPSIVLTSGAANIIPHKLSRPLIGYIITLRSADCSIWDEQSTNTQKDTYLNLQTSANVTVDIWVF